MRILNLQPVTDRGGGRFRDVAIFDAEIVDGLRLVGLKLAVSPDGKRFVFPPQKGGQRFAQITGEYARQLSEAAWAAKGGCVAYVES